MTARRQYLTPGEKADILRQQGWKCACGCGCPVWPGGPVEWDHTLPVGLGGTPKPDAALTPWCHARKTYERDIPMMRKADRQGKAFRGEKKRKGRAIPSRPFSAPPPGHTWAWPTRKFPGRQTDG